jgi:hypothetical protein
MQPQILAQALRRRRARAVRQIFGDRVGRLLHIGETLLRAAAHEAADFGRAVGVDARGHIHEDERRKARRQILPGRLPFRDHAGHAAERGPDQHRRRTEFLRHRRRDLHRVVGKIEHAVGAVGDPLGIAMAALVDGESGPPGFCQRLGGSGKRMPRLPAAMQQDRRPLALAVAVGDELVAGGARESFRLRCTIEHHGLCCKNSSTPCLKVLSPTANM